MRSSLGRFGFRTGPPGISDLGFPIGGLLLLTLLLPGYPVSAAFTAPWPGPYPGSRILGSNGVCAVWSESPERTTESFGITHYYRGSYARDYIHTGFPRFEIAGSWENALGTEQARRARNDLKLVGENFASRTEFRSLSDSAVRISYRVYATVEGALVFDISILNEGDVAKTVLVEPVVRFREAPIASFQERAGRTRYSVVTFDSITISAGFIGDENISAVESARGAFPYLRQSIVVSPSSISRTSFVIFSADGGKASFPDPSSLSWDAARAAWQEWLKSGDYPPASDSRVRSAYEAALTALRATVLNGAVPADMTGQFMTMGRPQLYPRDALMTARALMEAGHLDLAAEIVRFWDRSIPQKTRGEWYARYDAWKRPTPGGDGAPYDLPEWDSNGYYATMMLELFLRTGRWEGDASLMRELLDFILRKQDGDGLVHEGGIIEWEGRLPASNMNLAVGLRYGAVICEILGDRRDAARYRAAAGKMEKGLAKLFSARRGAYMDVREGREQFNTSANFGWIWGYPDHYELSASNAWYRRNAFHLGHGVRYFEADGYGSDLFGFTTGASAQFQAVEGDPAVARDQVKWMMARTNVYGMLPERVLSPDGRDVSPASPLSWCNAEFTAAVSTIVRVGDPELLGHGLYPAYSLASRLERISKALTSLPRSARPPGVAAALAAIEAGVTAARGSAPVEERLRAIHAAVVALKRLPAKRAVLDLGGSIARIEDELHRAIWNRSGARWALGTETSAVAAGETFSLIAWLGSSPEITWDAVTYEARDGNAAGLSGSIEVSPYGGAFSRTLKFDRGQLPYSTAIRATARGRWKDLPLVARRTLSLDVNDAYQVERSAADNASSRVTIRRLRGDGSFDVRFETVGIWAIVEETNRGGADAVENDSSLGRTYIVIAPDTLSAGIHTLRFSLSPDRIASRSISLPVRAAVSIEGPWRFRLGDDSAWSAPGIDESAWASIVVPSKWEDAGHEGYDGYAWYRLAVIVPVEWRGRDIQLVIGAVDDQDWTYWNGRLVGHITTWNAERRHTIPAAEIRYGAMNAIAVRVFDSAYGGGIWRGPVRLEIAPSSGSSRERTHAHAGANRRSPRRR